MVCHHVVVSRSLLIAFRLLQRVLATIVESAALYTYVSRVTHIVLLNAGALHRSYTVFFFGTYEAENNIQYTAVDTLCPIAGIAFMMINVRVGLGWAQRAHPSLSSGVSSRRHDQSFAQSYAMRPVAVDISKVVQSHDDMGLPVGVKSELPNV